MGVHGLWKILEPAHRPVKLETLARKRLAVDASIWIYQFLKAVRDAEGNALHNSHIVGFFRRICKLLFHGIRPVFVFDGGAPVLKRQTIAGRKQRREGRKEDAAQTAKKLLALQVKKRAEEEAEARRGPTTVSEGEEEPIPENLVYVDELEQTTEERKQAEQQRKRKFKRTDQYQLPQMDYDFSELGVPNDVRMLSAEELQEYAKQFEGMEDTNLQDFSNIDFSSPFFAALPDADRYRILSQARVRSRLRMGYSKEQLDAMFPNRMAFSKFQIERLKRRNELSQRLMNLQGREKDMFVGRVAGEKNKEYIMVRNEEAGGWSMSFVGNKGELEGAQSKPIDVEKLGQETEEKDVESNEEEEFEDVPIEGLNRLPKAPAHTDDMLFGAEFEDYQDENDLDYAIAMSLGDHGFQKVDNEDEDLERAIAMSMGEEPAQNKGKGKQVEPTDDSFSEENYEKAEGQDLNDNDKEFQLAVAESLRMQGTKPGAAPQNSEGNLSKSSSILFGKNSSKPLPLPTKIDKSDGLKQVGKTKEENPIPLPPWFAGGGKRDIMAELERAKEQTIKEQHEYHEQLEARKQKEDVVTLSSDDEDEVEFMDVDVTTSKEKGKDVTTDELAERLRANPYPAKSNSGSKERPITVEAPVETDEEIEWSESEDERPAPLASKDSTNSTIPLPALRENIVAPVDPPAVIVPGPPSPILPIFSPPPIKYEEPDDLDISFEAEQTPPPEELTPEAVDEGELLLQMEREAEEHARFAAEVSRESNRAQNALDYERELKSLRKQQKKDLRDADEVSQMMIQECQQLLKLFGLPYITAPMEAEAQCAELVKLGLVDGIVTDDSDVFLFGGTRVYRHMFNDRHTVQCYLTSDLEKEFSLDQKRLIAAAQLLGSDYTEGIPNIGPVTAIELLAEFANNGLTGFKDWWTRVQQGIDAPDESSTRFKKRFKRLNVAKIFLPPSFPDPRVEDAYIHPEVDSDPSAFEWGVPDLEGLRTFLMNTLGWSKEKTDEILLPVVKDMNRKVAEGSQVNITNFFGGVVGAGAFAPRVRAAGGSKRMEQAMAMLKGKADEAGEENEQELPERVPISMGERFAQAEREREEEQVVKEPPKKKKRRAPAKRKMPIEADEDNGDGGEELEKEPPKKRRKAPAKRKTSIGEEGAGDGEGEGEQVEEEPSKATGRKTTTSRRKGPARRGKGAK
ncbi:PIN domain-like protein [Wilcoxina mikolae CBS 423.85]|nr:PIN domain-like protein [Wilcoxina mikolae CBS 423.85]